MRDAFIYPSKYDHNPCKKRSGSNSSIGKIIRCQSNIESTLEEFRIRRRLLVIRKLIQKILQSVKTPGCGVRDGPLFYSAGNRW